VPNDLHAEFGTAPATEDSERQNTAQLLFLSCLHSEKEVGRQVPLFTMSLPSPRTVAPPPCLPLDIKDSLKEDGRIFDEGYIDWLAAAKLC
jgi:hypothetical protein